VAIDVLGPRMHDVLRARSVNRLLLRRRRTTALLGTILVLGVVGLNAHAALPEHHDAPGHATMCIGALSIAILAAAGLATRSLEAPATPLYSVRLPRVRSRIPANPAGSNARAGPAVPIVLRR
jgi:hypothetical protein